MHSLYWIGTEAIVAAIVIILLVLLLRKLYAKGSSLAPQFDSLDKGLERIERGLRDEIAKNRDEMARSLKSFSDSSSSQILGLTQLNEQKLESIRASVEGKLKQIQDDNSNKLEQMRATVDEKLHETLEKRLGESFKFVSDRLESVQRGLGEMQTLAAGVGDLKKVLTNVKTRGTWGEVQLGNLLEQILAPEQYAQNISTKIGSKDVVEFAVKMPGRDEGTIWLPIDAKFPKEDYERLIDAQERTDLAQIEIIGKALEQRIRSEAKNIKEKYIDPPNTTDFGILFLSTEGLYAEAIRRPGLCELLQREYKVVITGPTTIAALLNSLQMGFRSIAIGKRASEVWDVLGAVKTEFGKFGMLLERTQKQLETVSGTIGDAIKKTKTIERRLKDVETLPVSEAAKLLSVSEEIVDDEAESHEISGEGA